MKNLKLFIIAIIAIFSFNACQQDDDLEFVAAPNGDFMFTNTFLQEYLLTQETSDNIAERFVFSNANFEAPTNINYQLQYSILGDFSDAMDISAATNTNEIAITIGDLLDMATAAGLDNDPDTSEPDSGDFAFRVRAYPGDGSSTTELFSMVQMISVRWLEQATGGGGGIEPSTWGVVGSGYNDWGNAGSDGVFYTTGQADVYVAYVNLIDGEIKFRENNDWTNNFGDTGLDGTLDAGGDNIAVTAGGYKITLDLGANTYTMENYSWGVVGSGYNDWGNAGPDGKFYYDYTTDTFKAGLQLLDGEIKFRLNNDWTTNFGDTGADGTLDDGGDNIVVSAGHYNITIDFNAGTYTIEAGDVWGIVGSGYNDWGNGGPDYAFTQVNPDIYVAEVVDLVDGEIKFRVNNDWTTNNGDTGADGTLDAGGDNIVVTAGKYRAQFDLANGTYMLNKIQ